MRPSAGWSRGASRVGVVGPRGADDALVERLKAGEGARFVMRDDDGEPYYEGRYLDARAGAEPSFAPLDDFGAPDSGCTSIEFWNAERGAWEVL